LRAVPRDRDRAESAHHDQWARISRVATMLRAQKLALAFAGDDASGWAASILQATAEPGVTGVVGSGATRADAAEDAWRRRTASNLDSDVRCLPSLGKRPFLEREEDVMSTTTTMWVWRTDLVEIGPIEGFSVEAQDGSIGKIDEATNEIGGSYVVIDTGPWIFGKKVLLPAGMIERVDRSHEQVFVGLTKEQIKNAPEFDEITYRDDDYRSSLGDYYAPYLTR